MDKLDRIYELDKLLKRRKTPISRSDLERFLGLKRASTNRLLGFCRDRLHMPIQHSRELGGYYYDESAKNVYELPGLWFNPSELRGLMVSHKLLAEVQPGVLQPYIAPLQQRIEDLLEHRRAGSKEVWKRIRILPMANREARLEDFQQVTDALVTRRKVRIVYSSRSKDEVTERWVSPQRLVYYRDNWYLDAWCHMRKGLRTFSLDQMRVLETGEKGREVPDEELDAHVTHTFGIFSGAPSAKATIHFSAEAARWVADEEWHPQQESRHLEDGKWELVVPYGNPAELIRDILKFGPDAEVISPPDLRKQVEEKLSRTLRLYRNLK